MFDWELRFVCAANTALSALPCVRIWFSSCFVGQGIFLLFSLCMTEEGLGFSVLCMESTLPLVLPVHQGKCIEVQAETETSSPRLPGALLHFLAVHLLGDCNLCTTLAMALWRSLQHTGAHGCCCNTHHKSLAAGVHLLSFFKVI